MFDALFKAKKLSQFFVGRVGSYLDLLRIEIELHLHDVKVQLISLIIMALAALFALFFTFLALVISAWDTPYRLMVAWGVVAVYVMIGVFGYFFSRQRKQTASKFAHLREEFKKDVQLAKESL